jgi:amino acid transporter
MKNLSFSFNGFKSICVIAGRAINPKKTITRALFIALITCLILYLGLQYAFNVNAIPSVLADSHSPYATILASSTLMIVLLYIGAISSPFSANIFNLNLNETEVISSLIEFLNSSNLIKKLKKSR